jgi:hypothetical protein
MHEKEQKMHTMWVEKNRARRRKNRTRPSFSSTTHADWSLQMPDSDHYINIHHVIRRATNDTGKILWEQTEFVLTYTRNLLEEEIDETKKPRTNGFWPVCKDGPRVRIKNAQKVTEKDILTIASKWLYTIEHQEYIPYVNDAIRSLPTAQHYPDVQK